MLGFFSRPDLQNSSSFLVGNFFSSVIGYWRKKKDPSDSEPSGLSSLVIAKYVSQRFTA